MTPRPPAPFRARRWLTPALLGLLAAACQAPAPRLQQLEAAQREQARELAQLRRALAARDAEVAQLQDCVDDLESAVYEADSTDYAEPPPLQNL